MSADILPLLPAITEYLVQTLVLDANVLRDSILQRIELMHFVAYVHVNAIMWHCGFAELRALRNGSCVELNPMELHRLYYDKLWVMGGILQGETPLSFLDVSYRPWPKLKQDNPEVVNQYDRLETNLAATRELLLSHQNSRDNDQYNVVLKEVLRLFGEGIHESLTRTMGDFLEAIGGAKAESKLEEWEKKKCVTTVRLSPLPRLLLPSSAL